MWVSASVETCGDGSWLMLGEDFSDCLMGGVERFLLNFGVRNVKMLDSCGLRILSLNINRLGNKLDRLEYFLGVLGIGFDVIMLCETFSDVSSMDFLNLKGYNAFHHVRDSLGGGLAIFVEEGLAAERIGDSFLNTSINDNYSEFMLVKLSGLKVNLCATYRRPISDHNEYLTKLDRVLGKYGNTIVAGDLNIDWYADNSSLLLFKAILNSNGFRIFNGTSRDSYTRKSYNGTVTLIDYVFTDIQISNSKFAVGDSDISDHRFLILGFQTTLQRNYSERVFSRINYNRVNEAILGLEQLEFSSFHTRLTEVVESNKSIIRSVNYVADSKEWFTNKLRSVMNNRDHFYRLKRDYPNTDYFKEQFIYYRNLLNSEVKKAKKNYYSDKIQSNLANASKTWRVFNEIIFNKPTQKTCQIPTILSNGQYFSDSTEKANILNNFFCSAANDFSINRQDGEGMSGLSVSSTNSLTNFEPTNPEEVSQVINSLQANSSPGFDDVNAFHLKSNIDFYSSYLASQINSAFLTSVFPIQLKVAKVIPIYKAGPRNIMDNYRPISILSCFSKVYEIILYRRLEAYLKEISFIHTNQFGFLKQSSTASASASLLNEIAKRTNQRLKTACIFLDIKKAFDSVNHNILIKILRQININGPALELLRSFLSDRHQFVLIDKVKSSLLNITRGVPQGSILGPLLFLIYINGICDLKLHSYIQLYADDAVMVIGDESFESLKAKIAQDLTQISSWLQSVDLSLNTNKSKFLIIRKINRDLSQLFTSVSFHNSTIYACKQYDYLGLRIDENLNWELHIGKVCSKLSKFAFVFRKLKFLLHKSTLDKLYYAHVHSHLIYLLPIWGSAPVTYLRNLQFLQNKILKTINSLPFDTPTISLYSYSTLSINQQYSFEAIFLIHKMVNGLLRNNFNFSSNFQLTGVSTRSSGLLRLPEFGTTGAKKSIFYHGISLYNCLPTEIKSINSLSIFKRRLSEYVFNKYPVIRVVHRGSV